MCANTGMNSRYYLIDYSRKICVGSERTSAHAGRPLHLRCCKVVKAVGYEWDVVRLRIASAAMLVLGGRWVVSIWVVGCTASLVSGRVHWRYQSASVRPLICRRRHGRGCLVAMCRQGGRSRLGGLRDVRGKYSFLQQMHQGRAAISAKRVSQCNERLKLSTMRDTTL